MITTKSYVYGRHAVKHALVHKPHTIEQIFLDSNFDDAEIRKLIRSNNIGIQSLATSKAAKEISDSATHQGIVATILPEKLVVPYKEFIKDLKVGPHTALIILGEIQDPQNVGAIIRSAAAFGIAGILIPEHNQAQISGTVVKVSAGMAFRIPLVSIGNVNTTMLDLKEHGFWSYGLDGEAKESITNEKFDAPTVFVLGNEATGIRQKTLENCDFRLTIPMHNQCESLNVAASTAIALYAWSTKHLPVLK